MATAITVPYTIAWDSGAGVSEAWPADGATATVRLKCLTSDRYQLARDLMGTTTRSGSTYTRTPPFRYPPSPNLYCKSIESIQFLGPPVPLAGTTNWTVGNHAILTARFATATWSADGSSDISGQPYTTTSFSVGTELLTTPQSVYKFAGSPKVPTNTPTVLNIPLIHISLKRHMMPDIPVDIMESLVGKCNAAIYLLGRFAFAAGTLLFLGGEDTERSDTLGNVMYDCEYKFAYRRVGWNNALHPNGTTGFAAITDGNSNPPYILADLTTLP
jgi:hypothetical protein